MNLRVFASASALVMVVGIAGVASAQTKAGAVSVAVTGNWDPSIGGTMHDGGSGKVLGLTASFAGTGLENLNDKGSRVSLPVGVVVRF